MARGGMDVARNMYHMLGVGMRMRTVRAANPFGAAADEVAFATSRRAVDVWCRAVRRAEGRREIEPVLVVHPHPHGRHHEHRLGGEFGASGGLQLGVEGRILVVPAWALVPGQVPEEVSVLMADPMWRKLGPADVFQGLLEPTGPFPGGVARWTDLAATAYHMLRMPGRRTLSRITRRVLKRRLRERPLPVGGAWKRDPELLSTAQIQAIVAPTQATQALHTRLSRDGSFPQYVLEAKKRMAELVETGEDQDLTKAFKLAALSQELQSTLLAIGIPACRWKFVAGVDRALPGSLSTWTCHINVYTRILAPTDLEHFELAHEARCEAKLTQQDCPDVPIRIIRQVPASGPCSLAVSEAIRRVIQVIQVVDSGAFPRGSTSVDEETQEWVGALDSARMS
uniref:Uncharacterized protein n=1 Tax=Rhizochromulina marina TaxID=1034831 RepID=A0A7S2WUE0_9STRA